MNAEIESLVFEHLRAIHADVGTLRDDMRDLRLCVRLGSY